MQLLVSVLCNPTQKRVAVARRGSVQLEKDGDDGDLLGRLERMERMEKGDIEQQGSVGRRFWPSLRFIVSEPCRAKAGVC